MHQLFNAKLRKIPQQGEDSHGDELTLHPVGDAGVWLEQADTQLAAEVVCSGGQAEVVAQADAGAEQGEQSQNAAQEVVNDQLPWAALGHQELLHHWVIEAALCGIAVGRKGRKSRLKWGRAGSLWICW